LKWFSWFWCTTVLLAFSLAVAASVRPCTPAMVTAGLCTSQTDVLLHYSIPVAVQEDFTAAWSERIGYSETIVCGPRRQVRGDGILEAAGPADPGCSAGTVGEEVANPQTRAQAVDAYIRHLLASEVRDYRVRQRVEAEREAAEAEPAPELEAP
jgi:hypothetical protein